MWKGCLCYKENLPNLTHNFEICPSWTNIWPLCFQATICCVAVMWHGWFFWAFLTSGLPSGCPDRCHSKPSASRSPVHWFYALQPLHRLLSLPQVLSIRAPRLPLVVIPSATCLLLPSQAGMHFLWGLPDGGCAAGLKSNCT